MCEKRSRLVARCAGLCSGSITIMSQAIGELLSVISLVVRNEELKPVKYLIADAAKHSESGKLVAFYCCGIVKAPVDAVSGSWKHRALFVRIVTHRDHVIESRSTKLSTAFERC